MIKTQPIIKIDTTENWDKAVNYIPAPYTIIIYQDANNTRYKFSDGETKLKDLPFINVEQKQSSVTNGTLQL